MRRNIKPHTGIDSLLFGQDKFTVSQVLQPEKLKTFDIQYTGNTYREYYLKTGFILEYTNDEKLGSIEIVEPLEIEFLGNTIQIINFQSFLDIFLKYDPNVKVDIDGFFSEKFKMGVYIEDDLDDPNAKVETLYLMSDEYYETCKNNK